jgi:hypothetical protein
MREPTVSIPSAQRAFANGFAGPEGFSQCDDRARPPVFFRSSTSSAPPAEAVT